MASHVVVIGVGNLLARDDGLGPCVIERLQACGLPDVECIDAGTDLVAVLPAAELAARLILVDALRAGGEAGTVYRMSLEELLEKARLEPMKLSMHDMGLVESVRLAALMGRRLPPTIVFGMEPAEVGLGMELSAVVRDRLDGFVAEIEKEIRREW